MSYFGRFYHTRHVRSQLERFWTSLLSTKLRVAASGRCHRCVWSVEVVWISNSIPFSFSYPTQGPPYNRRMVSCHLNLILRHLIQPPWACPNPHADFAVALPPQPCPPPQLCHHTSIAHARPSRVATPSCPPLLQRCCARAVRVHAALLHHARCIHAHAALVTTLPTPPCPCSVAAIQHLYLTVS